MAARIDSGRVQLLTRTGLDWSDKYPSVIASLAKVRATTAYLDGELCGIDEAGLPSFSQTQAASNGESGVPLFYAFDLMHLRWRACPEARWRAWIEGVVSKTIGHRMCRETVASGARSNALAGRNCRLVRSGELKVTPRRTLGRLLQRRRQAHLRRSGRHGPVGQSTCRLASAARPVGALAHAAECAATPQDPLRIAAQSLPRALGRAATRGRDHVSDLDRRRPSATHGFHRPPIEQARDGSSTRSATSHREIASAPGTTHSEFSFLLKSQLQEQIMTDSNRAVPANSEPPVDRGGIADRVPIAAAGPPSTPWTSWRALLAR